MKLFYNNAGGEMKLLSMGALALVLLAAGAGFVVVANTDWVGTANGTWGGLNPFTPWQGTLVTNDPPNYQFWGYWGNDATNYINSHPNYNSSTGKYEVGLSAMNKGKWYYQGTERGFYTGYYHPSATDTADGHWWLAADSSYANGHWWGDLAGD